MVCWQAARTYIFQVRLKYAKFFYRQVPKLLKNKRICGRNRKSFEFFRNNISADILPRLDAALSEMYVLFNVVPIEPRVMNSINEEIKVKQGSWQTQYEELRQKLVPGRGKSETLQGEMIRIVGKITYEILDNGGMNWDAEYKKMANALKGYLKQNEKWMMH